ncbi:hypothetical protein YC2023_015403 [Brassica napus]
MDESIKKKLVFLSGKSPHGEPTYWKGVTSFAKLNILARRTHFVICKVLTMEEQVLVWARQTHMI